MVSNYETIFYMKKIGIAACHCNNVHYRGAQIKYELFTGTGDLLWPALKC